MPTSLRKRYKHLFNSIAAMILMNIIGTIGFMIFEHLSLFDALWLTVITVLTVGYGDTIPVTQEGKVFALIIIPVSVGIVSYAIGAIASLVVEGEFSTSVRARKMNKKLGRLQQHIIVCGLGRVGEQVLAHVREKQDIQAVFIDRDEELLRRLLKPDECCIHGDATEDQVLKSAGIERASALVATLPSDADNVFITLTAKGLNPQLTIVSRAERDETAAKLRMAGAMKVINPSSIGGKQMVMSILKPLSVEYMDRVLSAGHHEYNIEEISIQPGSPFAGRSLKETDIRNQYSVTIVAILRGNEMLGTPKSEEKLQVHDKIIVFGAEEDLTHFEKAITP
ncbi:potassium channel family protein [Bacillus xiapuensis]|uniref:potassium channel family protein n=1 Tax=Bacillus xiapuensis TaxID=2014075 RepID=UPI001E291996|nr:potassium channel protein [Bacillus xiapuensis]